MKLLQKIFSLVSKNESKKIATKKSEGAKTFKERMSMKAKMFLAFLFSQSFVFGADIEALLEKVFSFLESGTAKSLVAIAFIGLGIYVLRNMERWKEILLNVIAIVVGLLTLLNARTLAGWFF